MQYAVYGDDGEIQIVGISHVSVKMRQYVGVFFHFFPYMYNRMKGKICYFPGVQNEDH